MLKQTITMNKPSGRTLFFESKTNGKNTKDVHKPFTFTEQLLLLSSFMQLAQLNGVNTCCVFQGGNYAIVFVQIICEHQLL